MGAFFLRNNLRRLTRLDSWMKKLYYNNEAFKQSTNFEHIKTHYYWSHPHLNPLRIIPHGPIPNIEPL